MATFGPALSQARWLREVSQQKALAEHLVLTAAGKETTEELEPAYLAEQLDKTLRFYYLPTADAPMAERVQLDGDELESMALGTGIDRLELLDKEGKRAGISHCPYRDPRDRDDGNRRNTQETLDRAVSRHIERVEIDTERAHRDVDRERQRADSLQRQLDARVAAERLATIRIAELERQLVEARDGGWFTPQILEMFERIGANIKEAIEQYVGGPHLDETLACAGLPT